jgi:nitrogen fixation protein FixH
MTTNIDNGKPFTGRHMIIVMVSFFSVVIAVNFLMAYYANSTWSGLVVPNSYVASQEFNKTVATVKEQDARGWKDSMTASSGKITFGMKDASGAAVTLSSVKMIFRRPVTDTADMTIDLAAGPDAIWQAAHPLADGVWIAEIDVTSPNNKPWRDTKRFTVKDGAIQ